jgi:signal transduction histidine kinase
MRLVIKDNDNIKNPINSQKDYTKNFSISPAKIRIMIAEKVLRFILIVAIGIIILSAAMLLLAAPDQWMRTIPNLIAFVPIFIVWYYLRKGRVRLASNIIFAALNIAFLSGMILSGGVTAPSYIAFMPLIVAAAWFYGRKFAIIFGIYAIILGAIFVWLSAQGYLREVSPIPTFVMWFLLSCHMVFCLIATVIPNQMLHDALAESESRRMEAEHTRQKEMETSRMLAERERALRESEHRLGILADNLPSAMLYQVVATPDGKRHFTYVSENILRLNEVSVESVLGDADVLYSQIHPDDLPVLAKKEEEAIARMKLFRCEVRLLLPSGKMRWFQLTSNPRKLPDGSLVFDGLQIDITDRKREEEEKKQLEALLQRAEKMEAIGTLAGGVAHDLNNILTGIVSYPDLLLLQLEENSPLRKPIKTIQESGKKATAVVQDLLTLARRGVSVSKVINLNTIITDYLKSQEHMKLMSFHPDIRVEFQLANDLMNILGSPIHLSKTIMNLVSNASEAMPSGGSILISTENRYIDKTISSYDNINEGDYVVLTISDTGIGIASADKEKIFEPFYTSKKMGKSGTGLGMAVVWGTVKDHNGYIDIDSTERKGTTFTLYFPVVRKDLAADNDISSINEYKGNGEKILIVDDIKSQREIASMILTQLGYLPADVSSGEEAIEYVKNNNVDLLILDMIMDPGMDGLDTYRNILEINPKQKAIIISGFSDTDRVKETQKLGAGQYIKKPYTLEKLGIAVRSELDK